jgi:hypothetical protein
LRYFQFDGNRAGHDSLRESDLHPPGAFAANVCHERRRREFLVRQKEVQAALQRMICSRLSRRD